MGTNLIATDDARLPGIDSRLRAVSEMEFAQDVGDVALDRLGADDELLRDFAIVFACGDEAQHLQFARGQFVKRVENVLARAGNFLHHARGDARMDDGFAGVSAAHRIGKFVGVNIFENVRERAGADGGKNIFVSVVRGEDDNLRARAVRFDETRSLNAIHIGHVQVHENDVRRELGDEFDSRLAIFRFTDDLNIGEGVEIAGQAETHNAMVVHEDEGDWVRHFRN